MRVGARTVQQLQQNLAALAVKLAAEDLAERDVSAVIARQSDLLRDDAAFLDELALAVDPTDARMLREAPAPLARRAVRRWLADGHPPDASTVERVLEVARGAVLAADVGGHRRVARTNGRLRLESAHA